MKVQLLENWILPTKGREWDSCHDLYSSQDFVLKPHTTWIISTGICLEIPDWYYGRVYGRSWLSVRWMLVMAGVIDSNYRWEIGVVAHNLWEQDIVIEKWDRIAQLAIQEVIDFQLELVDELSDSNRGTDGYWSSGK